MSDTVSTSDTVKFLLGERDIPTHWVNLMADLPGEAPPPLYQGPYSRRSRRRFPRSSR